MHTTTKKEILWLVFGTLQEISIFFCVFPITNIVFSLTKTLHGFLLPLSSAKSAKNQQLTGEKSMSVDVLSASEYTQFYFGLRSLKNKSTRQIPRYYVELNIGAGKNLIERATRVQSRVQSENQPVMSLPDRFNIDDLRNMR